MDGWMLEWMTKAPKIWQNFNQTGLLPEKTNFWPTLREFSYPHFITKFYFLILVFVASLMNILVTKIWNVDWVQFKCMLRFGDDLMKAAWVCERNCSQRLKELKCVLMWCWHVPSAVICKESSSHTSAHTCSL